MTLIASSIGAPRVIADENGEVHYWSSSTSYVPQDEATTTHAEYVSNEPVQYVDVSQDTQPAEMMAATPLPGGHVYMINDDPGYDLSGPNDHWFLVGDGTAFRDDNGRHMAALASTGGFAGHEVVPVTAEFRQDWLAVAAGDRPVRSFTTPRATTGAGVMAVIPMENHETGTTNMAQYSSAPATHDTFRPVSHPRRRAYHATRPVRYSSMHRVRHTNYSNASYSNANYEPAVNENVANENAVEAQPAVEVSQDRMGNELFQMGSSWYMKQDHTWYRAESWRGPFARTHTRTVPREVKMASKHSSRLDQD